MKKYEEKDYLGVLGLKAGATEKQVKAKAKRMQLQHHPDKNNGSELSTKVSKAISDARDKLVVKANPEFPGNRKKPVPKTDPAVNIKKKTVPKVAKKKAPMKKPGSKNLPDLKFIPVPPKKTKKTPSAPVNIEPELFKKPEPTLNIKKKSVPKVTKKRTPAKKPVSKNLQAMFPKPKPGLMAVPTQKRKGDNPPGPLEKKVKSDKKPIRPPPAPPRPPPTVDSKPPLIKPKARPLPINTDVKRVKGPKASRSKQGSSMDDRIPLKRPARG